MATSFKVKATESYQAKMKVPEPNCPDCKGTGTIGERELTCPCRIAGWTPIPNEEIEIILQ